VAQQPCLIYGRRPTHVHHVRFAEKRALGMEVSDEFTVPLCSVHRDTIHRIGEVTTPSKDYSSRSRNGRRCRV
jgi:hypothetical protein